MNTKRIVAMGLSATWLLMAVLADNDIIASVMLAISHIWLAAALLAGGKR
jgi:hypothetical protein